MLVDDTENDDVPVPDPEPDSNDMSPREALAQMQELFSTLVPPDKIMIEDALGNQYHVKSRMPARSQIILMRHIGALMDINVPASIVGTGAGDLAGMLIGLAQNEQVLDGLCEAFSYAHPGAVAEAAAKAKAIAVESTHPADLFSIEDIVAGLVPFLIRFAARAANLMSQMTSPNS